MYPPCDMAKLYYCVFIEGIRYPLSSSILSGGFQADRAPGHNDIAAASINLGHLRHVIANVVPRTSTPWGIRTKCIATWPLSNRCRIFGSTIERCTRNADYTVH